MTEAYYKIVARSYAVFYGCIIGQGKKVERASARGGKVDKLLRRAIEVVIKLCRIAVAGKITAVKPRLGRHGIVADGGIAHYVNFAFEFCGRANLHTLYPLARIF